MYVPCIDCRLRHRPCFRPFSDEELKSISSLKTNHLAVAAKTDIVTEGEVGASLYTLYEGWAFRYKTLADGGRQILDLLLPQHLGDGAGLSMIHLNRTLTQLRDERLTALEDKTLIIHDRRRLAELSGYASLRLIPQRVFL